MLESDFKSIMRTDIKFYSSPSILSGYKHEVRSALGIECKNLWYQGFFFIEKVIAFSLWLSETYPKNKHVNASHRNSIKRAWNAYYSFSEVKDNYKQRLSDEDRSKRYKENNTKNKTKSFKNDVLLLLAEGVSNSEIMTKYPVSRMTLSRWKKNLKSSPAEGFTP